MIPATLEAALIIVFSGEARVNFTAALFTFATLAGWSLTGVFLRSIRAERPLDNYSWYAYAGLVLVLVAEAARGFPVLGALEWNWIMAATAFAWTAASIASIYASEAAPTKIPLLTAFCGLFPAVTAIGIFFLFRDPIGVKTAAGIGASLAAICLIVGIRFRQASLPLKALLFAAVAVLGWGAVGILLRAAHPKDALEPFVWYTGANVLAMLVADAAKGFSFIRGMRWDARRLGLGAVWGAGSLSYSLAAFFAPLAIAHVTAISGLYPVFTAVLIFLIFRDRLTTRQWIGVVCAAGAIVLMSGI